VHSGRKLGDIPESNYFSGFNSLAVNLTFINIMLVFLQEVFQKKNVASLMAARALREASAAESVIRCVRSVTLCFHYACFK
jgi:heme exporter protein D